ncbi:S-layer homology domain-containing protein, partial [Oscillibacter valericigenes]
PAGSSFAGYIAFCVERGLISGYADGTFRPTGTLTGFAFLKMLLGALGYDQSIEGYTGTNWTVNVAGRA